MYFYFWVCIISCISACSFHFPRKNFIFSAFFPSFFHCWTFSSHSHTVRKKISFLQSREFLVSPLRLCVFFFVYNGVSLWWCHRRRFRRKYNERDLFCFTCSFLFVCLFAVGMFCFVLPYSLISHILSVELDTLNCTFLFFIIFIISYR